MKTLYEYRRTLATHSPYLEDRVDDNNQHHIGKYILSKDDLLRYVKGVTKFTKKDRSSFHYWFAHWCAYQMTALNLGVWKWKYLLHDAEKPWLKLLFDYKKVQKIHRNHNRHHLQYGLIHGWDKVDWLGMVIDWECCHYTKMEEPLDARETLAFETSQEKWKPYANIINSHILPILDKLQL